MSWFSSDYFLLIYLGDFPEPNKIFFSSSFRSCKVKGETNDGVEKCCADKEASEMCWFIFTFRKLLHCITCGYKAPSPSTSSVIVPSPSLRRSNEHFVSKDDKWGNGDYGSNCIMSNGKDLLFSHIWKADRFTWESLGIIHEKRRNFSCRIMTRDIRNTSEHCMTEVALRSTSFSYCKTSSSADNQQCPNFNR